jgi:RNA polymerase sigma-70 factor (ECF subfamily)
MRFIEVLAAGIPFALLQVALRSRSDADLVQRLKAREPKAMYDLYSQYGRIAYSVIFRIVRGARVAEDLLQETLLHVWNRAASFDGERGALGPWILTIARNRAIDYLRTAENRKDLNAAGTDRLESLGLFHALDHAHLSPDCAKRVRKAFASLSEKQKLALSMAFFEGTPQTEIAEKLRQPLETVKEWTVDALDSMRSALLGSRLQ